jgi:hypothetical protein
MRSGKCIRSCTSVSAAYVSTLRLNPNMRILAKMFLEKSLLIIGYLNYCTYLESKDLDTGRIQTRRTVWSGMKFLQLF